jgi:hypothetical protein
MVSAMAERAPPYLAIVKNGCLPSNPQEPRRITAQHLGLLVL